jgi:hypothetical protein
MDAAVVTMPGTATIICLHRQQAISYVFVVLVGDQPQAKDNGLHNRQGSL